MMPPPALHGRMRRAAALLALLATCLALSPSAVGISHDLRAQHEALVAEHGEAGCVVSTVLTSCVIACAPFLHVEVLGIGGEGRTTASCGGATASCLANLAICSDVSDSPAASVSIGTCRYSFVAGNVPGFGVCLSPVPGSG